MEQAEEATTHNAADSNAVHTRPVVVINLTIGLVQPIRSCDTESGPGGQMPHSGPIQQTSAWTRSDGSGLLLDQRSHSPVTVVAEALSAHIAAHPPGPDGTLFTTRFRHAVPAQLLRDSHLR